MAPGILEAAADLVSHPTTSGTLQAIISQIITTYKSFVPFFGGHHLVLVKQIIKDPNLANCQKTHKRSCFPFACDDLRPRVSMWLELSLVSSGRGFAAAAAAMLHGNVVPLAC